MLLFTDVTNIRGQNLFGIKTGWLRVVKPIKTRKYAPFPMHFRISDLLFPVFIFHLPPKKKNFCHLAKMLFLVPVLLLLCWRGFNVSCIITIHYYHHHHYYWLTSNMHCANIWVIIMDNSFAFSGFNHEIDKKDRNDTFKMVKLWNYAMQI